MSAVLSLHVSGNVFELLGNFSSLRPPLSSSTPHLASRQVGLLRRAVELLVLPPGLSPCWGLGKLGRWEPAPLRVTPGPMGGC